MGWRSLSGFQLLVLMDPCLPLFVTAVSIYTNGTVFAADTNITFVAVTKETLPLEFMWYLGDDPPVRTTSRSIRRRLSIPQWSVNTVFSADAANSQEKDHLGTVTIVLLMYTFHPAPKHFCVLSLAIKCKRIGAHLPQVSTKKHSDPKFKSHLSPQYNLDCTSFKQGRGAHLT